MKLFKQPFYAKNPTKNSNIYRKPPLISLKIPVYLQINQWIFRINHFSQLV